MHSIILIYNVYGTIDNIEIRRNRLGQNKDHVNLHWLNYRIDLNPQI